MLLTGHVGYFATALAEYNQPTLDSVRCSRYYGSLTTPSCSNALVLLDSSGIQTNAFGAFYWPPMEAALSHLTKQRMIGV